MDDMKNRVKDLLAERGMTLKQLASEMEISKVWLNVILSDENKMSIRHLKRIAEILKVDMWEILYDRSDLISSIRNENVGFQVQCPYCHRVLSLCK